VALCGTKIRFLHLLLHLVRRDLNSCVGEGAKLVGHSSLGVVDLISSICVVALARCTVLRADGVGDASWSSSSSFDDDGWQASTFVESVRGFASPVPSGHIGTSFNPFSMFSSSGQRSTSQIVLFGVSWFASTTSRPLHM
jgi:hypothetical protein